MARSDRHERAAAEVEAKLRAEGRAFDADQIARLRRSLGTARRTLAVLHPDNMDLRAKVAQAETARLREAVKNARREALDAQRGFFPHAVNRIEFYLRDWLEVEDEDDAA